ncbi:hypothetical protein [Streptomyces sp. NPDC088925]|uniref:hypothetical protein n=1 Tax=Streptomyces sp. NPDC088925 TaxID=3365914 RepID=UPI003829DDA7
MSKRSCGYAAVPTSASLPSGASMPYHVLYELGQAVSGPAWGDESGDARLLFQVTTVGQSPDTASSGADKVRQALLGKVEGEWQFAIVPPSGYEIMGRELDREDGMTVVGATYSYVQRFALHVTTSG